MPSRSPSRLRSDKAEVPPPRTNCRGGGTRLTAVRRAGGLTFPATSGRLVTPHEAGGGAKMLARPPSATPADATEQSLLDAPVRALPYRLRDGDADLVRRLEVHDQLSSRHDLDRQVRR